ncbi:glycosyl transferase family 1 [Paramesorhizobium deserti]|uniref:Glycosyl transferase family 1 n=1 Tax=Paramesorhizobium deserti TaxID=1494590 RepID=A0A135HZB6_9HYPH|nr:glycosyltransferase [Paramesorhizobium deserti]KXF78498.1 glycosyl transferase family 1 [Paramesorhizobium deserti]
MVLTVLSVAYPFAPVGPDAVGGAEQVLSALDHALVEHGHRSLVIACRGSLTAGELIAVDTLAETVDDQVRERVWAAWRARIREVLRRVPDAIVHLHGIDFPAYIPEYASTLATLHLPLDWYPAWIFRPRANLWLNCVSEAQHATRPAGAQLLAPVPNGVSHALFETSLRKREHAIMLSRICPEKGVHIALEACHMADAPLLIGGQVFAYEAHRRYFEESVAPLLDKRRRFLGPLGFHAKRRLLASARCALIPSLVAETSSLTAIEALACGTPVIAFANGALPSVIEHGRTGFIVHDAREMAEAIAAAETLDPAICKAAAAERFSLEKMTGRYFRVYEQMAKQLQASA